MLEFSLGKAQHASETLINRKRGREACGADAWPNPLTANQAETTTDKSESLEPAVESQTQSNVA